jgi:hypothetical protein
MREQRIASFIILSSLLLLPGAAWAQSATTGSIAGVVKDTTSAVLPGVTVEAASPALIEKVRTVVTDDQGNYKIVDLRPGAYAVTFTLPGFSPVKREGIELTTGFTATVNAELKVGTLAETVTVMSASPVVDIQNVRSQNVLSRAELDSVPTARNFSGFATLTLGATMADPGRTNRDVAGSAGEGYFALALHGSRVDGHTTLDGVPRHPVLGTGALRRYFMNEMAVQEVVVETSGMSAESETGGVQVNLVPKDGGNTFHGTFDADYTGEGLQNGNLSDELRARGLIRSNSMQKIYSGGGGLGGPIKKDTLWFYTANRWWGTQEELAGVYYNTNQHSLFYTPDFSRPAHTQSW